MQLRRKLNRVPRWVQTVGICLVVVLVFSACTGGSGLSKSIAESMRENSVNIRWGNLQKATSIAPDPANLTNFPLRQALLKYTERQDQINHPWYIYVMGMNGDYLGYYVSPTFPQSTCNFLGSTEDIRSNSEGKVVVTAPSYDGMFYGNCSDSSMFFFDQTTDALVVYDVPAWFASDQPLPLDVKLLNPTS